MPKAARPRAPSSRASARPGAPASRRARAAIAVRSEVAQELLHWFDAGKRDLPWRKTADAYAIWVSEIMLQQTRVEVVKRYYQTWMERFPNVQSLAQAKTDDVLRVWQGLGYYSRARRLQEGAVYIVREHQGIVPRSHEQLLRVPGVGPYSAGAIGSIAFGQRVPAIDGNVVRVVCRYDALTGDPNRAPIKGLIEGRVQEWLPEERVGDFNQALMELGATVCLPRAPLCAACPVRPGCQGFAQGIAASLPTPKERSQPTSVRALPLLFRSRGRLLVLRLPEGARWWAGLSVLPTLEVGSASAGALTPLSLGLELKGDSGDLGASLLKTLAQVATNELNVRPIGPLTHTVTRHRVELNPFEIRAPRGGLEGLGERAQAGAALVWLRPSDALKEPLAAPFRKILERSSE